MHVAVLVKHRGAGRAVDDEKERLVRKGLMGLPREVQQRPRDRDGGADGPALVGPPAFDVKERERRRYPLEVAQQPEQVPPQRRRLPLVQGQVRQEAPRALPGLVRALPHQGEVGAVPPHPRAAARGVERVRVHVHPGHPQALIAAEPHAERDDQRRGRVQREYQPVKSFGHGCIAGGGTRGFK